MKKRVVQICSFLFILFCISCNKDNQHITISGHVTYNDKANTPVKNAFINLVVSYKKNQFHETHDDVIGTSSTDANGYYEIATDASIPSNSYKRYSLVFIDDSYGFYDDPYSHSRTYYSGIKTLNVNFNDKRKSITENLTFQASIGIKFHIKNTAPVNGNDLFNSIFIDNNFFEIPVNASGQYVDTVMFYFYPSYRETIHYLRYRGRYTKNGIALSLPMDSVLFSPLDTATVDLFY